MSYVLRRAPTHAEMAELAPLTLAYSRESAEQAPLECKSHGLSVTVGVQFGEHPIDMAFGGEQVDYQAFSNLLGLCESAEVFPICLP